MADTGFDSIKLTSGYVQSASTKERMGLGTIPTTVGVESSFIAKYAGVLSLVQFVGKDALATSDTNFITFSITNLGAGPGTTAMLAASPAGTNTTKVTGGAATAAGVKRTLTLNATPANLVIAAGDTILLSALVTGTLANTITAASLLLTITPT